MIAGHHKESVEHKRFPGPTSAKLLYLQIRTSQNVSPTLSQESGGLGSGWIVGKPEVTPEKDAPKRKFQGRGAPGKGSPKLLVSCRE